ncbi:protein argonaute-3-like isoform X1 [Macrobrachium nipponense]|uniref:protein argonaute-3-like isoform X1 n=1 Tax=Macrobrachium nipponense TaxID=159736 RepID=UPI0030C88440
MEEQPPKQARGRGGRGAMVLQALQAAARQPGQIASASATQPGPAVPPIVKTGGAGVQVDSESASEDGSSVASGISRKSSGRGALIAQSVKKGLSGELGGAADIGPEQGKFNIGRGRADIIRALKFANVTMQPGGEPLIPEPIGEDTKSSALTESMQDLDISDQDRNVVCKKGTSGAKFSGYANWIPLSLKSNMAVFEYEVKFQPSIDARNLRFRILNSQKDKLGSVKSFDGTKLWLPIKLPNEITVLSATQPLTGEPVTVKIIYKLRIAMDNCVQLYNVLFGRIMRILKMAKVGMNYYSPGGSILVPQHKLEIWPGYITAAHFMEGGLMLMVDVSHRTLQTETCYDVMSDIFKSQQGNFKERVSKELVGAIVLTRYNNQTYRIDDILFDQNAESTFTLRSGEEIRYIDYYKNVYDIKLKDPKQPLLLHRVTKKELKDKGVTKALCLMPELCFLTGLNDEMRADFRVMKDIAQYTRVTPSVRQASLRTFIKNVNENPEARQTLADWGLSLDESLISVEGRVLPPETIYFGSKEVPGNEMADFSREACREKVIMPVDLKPKCWVIMYFHKDEQRANKFADMLRQVTRCMGIQVGEPNFVRLQNDRIETYVNSLKKFYHDQLQIAVIIFPTSRDDRYSAVKRLACLELKIPTQCIISRTISQETKLRSVTQKIALQMNCKLGGELWALKIPMTGLMVCGIDVYHDPSRRGASVVGFVASMNNTLTRWFSNTSFQHPGDEIVHGLKISLLEALRRYHGLHHALPRTIIVYRDGVSDGQLKLIEDHEVPQVATIFQNFDSYEPKLSYIVVQKKINTRIFAAMSARNLDNPPPGSVVDHTITRRYWYDFLLVSQHVRQGTVSPTYYIVVRDTSNLKVDNMQKLSYKLTHLYYNWPGTVRVPAPCQYAHKLAYLIGQSVRKEPGPELADKLYFL